MIEKTKIKVYMLIEHILNSSCDGFDDEEVGICFSLEKANKWVNELEDQSSKPEFMRDKRSYSCFYVYDEKEQ